MDETALLVAGEKTEYTYPNSQGTYTEKSSVVSKQNVVQGADQDVDRTYTINDSQISNLPDIVDIDEDEIEQVAAMSS